MKLLMENWRKKLEEYDIAGVDYEPAVVQEVPEEPLSGSDAILYKALTAWTESWKANFATGTEPLSSDRMPHPQREELLTDLAEVFNTWSGKTLGTTQDEEEPPEEEASAEEEYYRGPQQR